MTTPAAMTAPGVPGGRSWRHRPYPGFRDGRPYPGFRDGLLPVRSVGEESVDPLCMATKAKNGNESHKTRLAIPFSPFVREKIDQNKTDIKSFTMDSHTNLASLLRKEAKVPPALRVPQKRPYQSDFDPFIDAHMDKGGKAAR